MNCGLATANEGERQGERAETNVFCKQRAPYKIFNHKPSPPNVALSIQVFYSRYLVNTPCIFLNNALYCILVSFLLLELTPDICIKAGQPPETTDSSAISQFFNSCRGFLFASFLLVWHLVQRRCEEKFNCAQILMVQTKDQCTQLNTTVIYPERNNMYMTDIYNTMYVEFIMGLVHQQNGFEVHHEHSVISQTLKQQVLNVERPFFPGLPPPCPFNPY